MYRFVFLVFLFLSASFADDVYYNNGCILTNVSVVDSTLSSYVIVTSEKKELKIKKTLVSMVIKGLLQKGQPSVVVNCRKEWGHGAFTKQTIKINGTSLALGVLASMLSWDYFSTAKSYQDNIDTINKSIKSVSPSKTNQLLIDDWNREIGRAKLNKNRKMIIGSIAVVIALYSYINSFDRIRLRAKSNTVSLSYVF